MSAWHSSPNLSRGKEVGRKEWRNEPRDGGREEGKEREGGMGRRKEGATEGTNSFHSLT